MSDRLIFGIESLDCAATGVVAPLVDTDWNDPIHVAAESQTRQLPDSYHGVVPDFCPLMIAPDPASARTVGTFAVCLECPNAVQIDFGGEVSFPGRPN